MPVFHSPENLAFALRKFHDYHAWRGLRAESGFGAARPMSDTQRAVLRQAQDERENALVEHTEVALSEYEAKRIIERWGVSVVAERLASCEDQAVAAAREIGFPVVAKVSSPDILHKTEAGVLRIGLENEDDLRSAYSEILANAESYAPGARIDGVLVGEMVRNRTEVIVGVSYDAQLGPVLLYGMGGVLVEVMRDVALRVCPISRLDAEEMVAQVRGSRLLQGFRGQPKADVEALVDTLVRVSDLAVHLEGVISELDINPLAVLPEGQGVRALDALVTLRQEAK